MITIISATHRPQNQTSLVVEKYAQLLRERQQEPKILRMDELPQTFMVTNTFGEPGHGLDELVDDKLRAASHVVIIAPEYNGSFPGILKVFIDAVAPAVWRGKKVALVGVASGRAGNLRGMDHLTDVLHHLRAEVFSLKVPISRLNDLIDGGEMIDEDTLKILRIQVDEFLQY